MVVGESILRRLWEDGFIKNGWYLVLFEYVSIRRDYGCGIVTVILLMVRWGYIYVKG